MECESDENDEYTHNARKSFCRNFDTRNDKSREPSRDSEKGKKTHADNTGRYNPKQPKKSDKENEQKTERYNFYKRCVLTLLNTGVHYFHDVYVLQK